MKGIGDVITKFAQPIAESIDNFFGTNIKNCDGCGKRRDWLNEQFPLNSNSNMQTYIVTTTKQYRINAENPDDAIEASKSATPVTSNSQARPVRVAQQQPAPSQQ